MRNLALLAAILFSANLAFAQTGAQKGSATETSDPAAKSLLDKLRKKYEGYKTLELAFSLEIEVPGAPKESQKGTLAQSGEKYRLEMTDQTIISDGKTTWVYLRKNNEVQINNADPKAEQSFISPRELMKMYQKGEWLYAMADEETLGGKLCQQVEFKPTNKKSEYSKLRLAIDKKAQTMHSIKAFAKDGSRYTFSVSKQSPNKEFAGDKFTFDKAKFPGCRVEDLRM